MRRARGGDPRRAATRRRNDCATARGSDESCGALCIIRRFVPDVATLIEDLGAFRPTFVLSVPRVFEKVFNTAKQRAHADGKGKIFDRAAQVAIDYSAALDSGTVPLQLKLQHKLFDRLVYGKLRAALGGRCEAAISGGAPLGSRLGHFYRGIGVTIFEGYGLTESTAGACLNLQDKIKIGTVGRPVPGMSVRIADDGELLMKGLVIFAGYWRNEAATAEALDADGWFHTGDIGEIDDDGFVMITGRKKELIVTSQGKNVAPAVLEDRLRAHWLVGQCLVVGDAQPFIAALITIDIESWPTWLKQNGHAADTSIGEMADDETLRAEIQLAVDDANKAVSKAESIRKFVVLANDWTEDGGQITPSLKLKRNVVMRENAEQIDALCTTARAEPALASADRGASNARAYDCGQSAARRLSPAASGPGVADTCGHCQSRVDPLAAGASHLGPAAGDRAAVWRSRSATASTSRPFDDVAGLAVAARRPAPHPNRPAITGRTAQALASRYTMPSPSTSRPRRRVRHGMAKTSPSDDVPGQLVLRPHRR